jgi:tetratricopeptide (TPR) repeat protein
MKTWHRTLVSAAIAWTSLAAQASTKTQDCFSLLKAQDHARAAQAGRQAVRSEGQSGDAFLCLGVAQRKLGDLDNALKSLQQAERLYTSKADLSATYSQLGSVANKKGDLQLAMNYFSRELGLARELGNKSAEASALNNISTVFDARGDQDKALDYLQQAARLEPDEARKGTFYANIGLSYSSREDYPKAIEYLDQAIAIARRTGNAHDAGIQQLNKGAVLTDKGDLAGAEASLQDGLAAVRKLKDQYWEAVGMNYLGNLEASRARTEQAMAAYREALRLAQASGASGFVDSIVASMGRLQKSTTAASYGVIEIGSKGVKAAVVTSSRDLQGRARYETGFRKSINANVIQGVVDQGEFAPEAMDATAKAVKELLAGMKEASPNLGNKITIAGSSAMAGALNRSDLAARIEAETGIAPIFINSAQEMAYALRGSVSEKLASKTALLDIGSGNGRIGYLISARGDRPEGQAVIDLRAGSVTLTDMANKVRAPGEDYLSALNRVVGSDLQPKLASELKQYPVLRRHQYFIVVGGAAWAMSTLLHPENQEAYVPLSRQDFSEYFARLSANTEAALNPKLDGITDAKVKEKAAKQIASVKGVFTPENLLAGARLLRMMGELDPFGQADIYFARDGNWAYGLAEAQALSKASIK